MEHISDKPAQYGTVVFLDGVEVSHVSSCDPTEGWLIRAVTDKDGNLLATGPKMDEIAKEKLTGVVTVKDSA